MERILNFQVPLDIPLLDAVVGAFYGTDKIQRETATAVLTQFQSHRQAWSAIMPILTTSKESNTRFLALSILQAVIKSSWLDLGDKRLSIMHTVVDIIKNLTSSEQTMVDHKLVLQKCNQLLAQILLREFPNWGGFIQNLISSAATSSAACFNSMEILKLIGEDLFERTGIDGQLQENIRNKLEQQPYPDLCFIVKEMGNLLNMSNSNPELATVILDSLCPFLDIVPLSHIINSISLDLLVSFLAQPKARVAAMKSLVDLGAVVTIKKDLPNSLSYLFSLFSRVTAQVASFVPCQPDDINRFAKNSPKFVQNFVVFLSASLKEVSAVGSADSGVLQAINTAQSYLYMFALSRRPDIVKVCLDYWFTLLSKLYQVRPVSAGSEVTRTLGKALLSSYARTRPIDVRLKIIFEMVTRNGKKEEQVKIEEIETGEGSDDEDEEDLSGLYKPFRELYVFLAHVHPQETAQLVMQELQVLGSGQWSAESLCGLSWIVACVNEAFSEQESQQLLTQVLAQFLAIRNSAQDPVARALVCICILHILGQSPRFLRSVTQNATLLCFECMQEQSAGVKEMACNTMLFIARTCKVQMCAVPMPSTTSSAPMTLTEHILNIVQQGKHGLNNHNQILLLYQAIGYCLSGFTDPTLSSLQQSLTSRILEPATNAINLYYGCNKDTLRVKETINGIVKAIQFHAVLATTLGNQYSPQFGRIFQDLVRVYIAYCEVPAEPPQQVKAAYAAGLRVKKEILKLFIEVFESSSDNDANALAQQLSQTLVPTAINDFTVAPAEGKPVDLVSLFTVWAARKVVPPDLAGPIVYGILKSSVQVLNTDYDNYTPLAIALWKFLQVFVENYTIGLFTADFQSFYEALLWGDLHLHKTSNEKSLLVLVALLQRVPQLPSNIQTAFLQKYFSQLLNHVLSMVVGPQYMALYSLSSSCFYLLGCLARSHSEYVQSYLDLCVRALESTSVTKEAIRGSFELALNDQNQVEFKRVLRDFITKLQQFSFVSTFDLYKEEQEKQAENERVEKERIAQAVPGMAVPC